jgi:alanyl-tRNA synthetase
MKSLEIRQKFFTFFTARNHTQVASSSLIPAQDPTLLFTNAGMNQFKDLFLGLEKRDYKRAVTIQKCVRAGGKHNDLDNVGFTKRHLTYFEMMGNFSFGDYFKKEAIVFAWDFLTKELALSTEALHATVYTNDDEAYAIWQHDIGLPIHKIHRLGEAENFWQMGDLGPCGPCTEIHLDRGPAFGCADINSCGPACNCDRFLEIWNLVFMQFDRQEDGSLKPLQQTGVDTGMGLERLCTVMQNVDSVFMTDLFANIITTIEEISGKRYTEQSPELKAAFHVLADHIRSSTFLIADGCAPSNEGRGYVLRKIIRRAALFAQKLTDKSIFPELSKVVVKDFEAIYPELHNNKTLIFDVLASEIKKFAVNLVRGQHMLQDYFAKNGSHKIVTGEQAFKLYDTYGFPIEVIHLMAHEHHFTVDQDGFEKYMSKQQEQSGKKMTDPLDYVSLPETIQTIFTGYQELETTSTITALVVGTEVVTTVPAGTQCFVIVAQSPFFIVGGGQVPDQGWLVINNQRVAIESVRYISGRIAALITPPVTLTTGMPVTSIVDTEWRTNAMKNHTATHMLQAALIQLFGKHIKQSGSLVHPDYLRFDFTYHENLSSEDIKRVEDLVNEKIRENIPVIIEYATLKQASARGVIAFFGDKYNPEKVRIVDVPGFSAELCGGTHVRATGEIGTFKITEVTALAAGYRRIVAVTGPKAIDLFQDTFNAVKTISTEYKVKREDVTEFVFKQKEQLKQLQIQIKHLKRQTWAAQLPQWLASSITIHTMPFTFIALQDTQADELKEITDLVMTKQPGFNFVISNNQGSSLFAATLSPEYKDTVNLKNLSVWLAEKYKLRGGVQSGGIRGGGANFDSNLRESLKQWLEQA